MDKIATVKNKVKYAEWISMVEDCRNSGLPVRVWCKENFVGYKTYYYRLRKLRSMFLECKFRSDGKQFPPTAVSSFRIER